MSNRQKNKRHREEVSRPPGNMSQQKTPTAVITSQLCPEAEYTCHIRAYQQQNQNYYGNSLPPRGSGATGPVRAQAGHLVLKKQSATKLNGIFCYCFFVVGDPVKKRG